MLDNVPAIGRAGSVHGPKLAPVALLFGASDLDRVSPSDDSPLGHRRAPLEEVQRNISAAFLNPIERDGRFEKVDAGDTDGEQRPRLASRRARPVPGVRCGWAAGAVPISTRARWSHGLLDRS